MTLVYFGFRSDSAPQGEEYRSAIRARRVLAAVMVLVLGSLLVATVLRLAG
jgi:hypothetical protein